VLCASFAPGEVLFVHWTKFVRFIFHARPCPFNMSSTAGDEQQEVYVYIYT